MAAAEARTARRCSRCYVHDVAASKFSFCPSSSSSYSSKSEFDHVPDTAAKEPQNTMPDYLTTYPNSYVLTDRRRWWLNQEPNNGRYKDFVSEHGISLEAGLEILSNGLAIKKTTDLYEEYQLNEELVAKTRAQSDVSSSMEQLKALTCDGPPKTSTAKDGTDFWYLDDHLMNLDSLNCCLVSQESKKLYSDFESLSLGSDKTGPWWRAAGKDDLASFVAQKSLEPIMNCDLPRPRATNYRKQPSAFSWSADRDDSLASSPLDRTAEKGFSNMESTWGTPNSSCSPHDLEKTFSCNSGQSTTSIGNTDAQTNSEDDQSKAKLMRALCLSQKRAREAENAAKKAYTEKEHIITLLFRQASQLFAYKQWLQLLQLENLCLQLKNKNQPICNLFPSVLPWTPCKGGQVRKGQHRAGRKRHGKPKYDISKCAVAFAVGLGLAGAGLLLGWTMGWLFPHV